MIWTNESAKITEQLETRRGIRNDIKIQLNFRKSVQIRNIDISSFDIGIE